MICVSTHQKVWTMELEQQRALRQLEELAAEVGLTSRLASRASNEPSQSLKLNNHNPLLVEKTYYFFHFTFKMLSRYSWRQ